MMKNKSKNIRKLEKKVNKLNKKENASTKRNKKGILALAGIILLCIGGILFLLRERLFDLYNKQHSNDDISADVSELQNGDKPDDLLQIHYIDVGQGDSTLITYKGHSMLIDAGDNSKGTAIQYYLKGQGIQTLDYAVVTHPDADHIGGMDVIIYKFDCENVFMPDISKDTQSYEDVMMSVEEKKYNVHHPYQGEEFYMDDIKFTVLWPTKELTSEDANDHSIVLLMEYKNLSFLFAGDAGINIMSDIKTDYPELKVDVYKVAHHGSVGSFNEDFLDSLNIKYGVISCGVDNDYSHPHKEILRYLEDANIQVYRTDVNGDIILYTDGDKIAWSTEK